MTMTARNIIAATLALLGFVMVCNESENDYVNYLGVALVYVGAWLGGAIARRTAK